MATRSEKDAYKQLEDSIIKYNAETRSRTDIDEVTKNRIILNNIIALDEARKKFGID